MTADEFMAAIEAGTITLVADEDPHGVVYDGGRCWYTASNGWRVQVFFDVDVLEEIHEIRDEKDELVSDWFSYVPTAEIAARCFAFRGIAGIEDYVPNAMWPAVRTKERT